MRLIKEILCILVGSAIIAYLFNLNQTKPLSIIKTEKKVQQISDSILFGDEIETPSIKNMDSLKNTKNTIIDTNNVKIDIQKNKNIPIPSTPENNTVTDSKSDLASGSNSSNKIITNEPQSNLEKTITYNQLLKIINNPKFLLIDARHTENYIKAKIGNAINIFPYGDEKEMMTKILDLPRDKTLVIYCDGGDCDSSHKLAEIIISFGFDKVFIYTGGWDEWTKNRGIKE